MACLAVFAPHRAEAATNNIDMLAFALGYYDIMDDNPDKAVDLRAEIRFATPLIWEIRPWVGAEVTTDASLYAAAGLLYDFEFAEGWYLTPSFGAGYFAHGGGKDLDSPLEFRSQIELGHDFANNTRFSIAFSHTSNASIGDHNPGVETLGFYVSFPLGKIF